MRELCSLIEKKLREESDPEWFCDIKDVRIRCILQGEVLLTVEETNKGFDRIGNGMPFAYAILVRSIIDEYVKEHYFNYPSVLHGNEELTEEHGRLIDYTEKYAGRLEGAPHGRKEGYRVFYYNGDFAGLLSEDKTLIWHVQKDSLYRIATSKSAESIKGDMIAFVKAQLEEHLYREAYSTYATGWEKGFEVACKLILEKLREQ